MRGKMKVTANGNKIYTRVNIPVWLYLVYANLLKNQPKLMILAGTAYPSGAPVFTPCIFVGFVLLDH